VVCDFVAPLEEMRSAFQADCTIWLDTISEGRFIDTNAIFEPPKDVDFYIKEQDAIKWALIIATSLK